MNPAASHIERQVERQTFRRHDTETFRHLRATTGEKKQTYRYGLIALKPDNDTPAQPQLERYLLRRTQWGQLDANRGEARPFLDLCHANHAWTGLYAPILKGMRSGVENRRWTLILTTRAGNGYDRNRKHHHQLFFDEYWASEMC